MKGARGGCFGVGGAELTKQGGLIVLGKETFDFGEEYEGESGKSSCREGGVTGGEGGRTPLSSVALCQLFPWYPIIWK